MTHPLQVLLVEDDWTVRTTLRDFLSKRNMQVTIAASLEEVIKTTSSPPPDVAIVDIVLPRRTEGQPQFDQNTGIEVAHLLRELYPDVGIIGAVP